ncbi:MAG: 1,4-beta-xylanase [Balneola sp.]
MRLEGISLVLILFIISNCHIKQITSPISPIIKQNIKSKFEPDNGKLLFFIGQDLEATGGLDSFDNGYIDYFDVPSGVTVYTNFSPGDQSYSRILKGNDGIKSIANWGAGYNCAQCYIDSENFKHSVLSIGLSMVNHEKEIGAGKRDYLIEELGEWIKNIKRPVFLRIGYEFDGWEWNHYNRKDYLKSWRRIHSIFEKMEVENVAFVWQSKGTGSDQKVLEKWYPGDDIVDWCAYSYFSNPDEEMITFARKHNKPVFIAEASPVLTDESSFINSDLSDSKVADKAWNEWFIPFFETINENSDVIKAFSYINVDWASQPMWVNNQVFQNVDSRIQKSEFISKKWRTEINQTKYLKPSPLLWEKLDN